MVTLVLGIVLPAVTAALARWWRTGGGTQRRLKQMERENEVMLALPEGHAARKALSKELKNTVRQYREYQKRKTWSAFGSVGLFFALLALGLLVGALFIEENPWKDPADGRLFTTEEVTNSMILAGVVFAVFGLGFMLGLVLIAVNEVRIADANSAKKKIKRVKRRSSSS